MTKDELRSVLPGGCNHEVAMKWVADPAAVLQARRVSDLEFTIAREPTFHRNMEYRIKPQVLRYRVALFKESASGKPFLMTTYNQETANKWESFPLFVCWAEDWQEVAV